MKKEEQEELTLIGVMNVTEKKDCPFFKIREIADFMKENGIFISPGRIRFALVSLSKCKPPFVEKYNSKTWKYLCFENGGENGKL